MKGFVVCSWWFLSDWLNEVVTAVLPQAQLGGHAVPYPLLASALQLSHSCSPFSCFSHNQKGSQYCCAQRPLAVAAVPARTLLVLSAQYQHSDKPEMAVMDQQCNSCAHEYG